MRHGASTKRQLAQAAEHVKTMAAGNKKTGDSQSKKKNNNSC
jgi:hypothetical protein